MTRTTACLLLITFVVLAASPSPGYSILTHEQVVDFLWTTDIRKILLEQYPKTTPEELRRAHAFAYGGSLIQDMGYYPGGNKFFSDLVHYVRTGDFIYEMIRQSRDVDELAFALGALAHYVSDINGHPTINRSVALRFPKLKKKYGDEVTYAEDHSSHIQTEFGFDVLEVAKQRYTSQVYRDFIGFEVAQDLLDRAFFSTYGLELRKVLVDEDMAIGSFRHAISVWMPRLTQVALITKKKELESLPNFDPKHFKFILKRAEYDKQYGNKYYRPGFFTRFLAGLVKILPKIGPLKALDIKPPDAETEKLYVRSVETTVAVYKQALRQTQQPHFSFADSDLDTGKETFPGEYKLADRAYAQLLRSLARDDFTTATPQLRSNLLGFYADLNQPFETKQHKGDWKKLMRDLDDLKRQSQVASTAKR